MPVKAVASPSKSSRLFRFAPSTTKRTKLAACLVLIAIVTLLMHPATRRMVKTDLAGTDAQPSSAKTARTDHHDPDDSLAANDRLTDDENGGDDGDDRGGDDSDADAGNDDDEVVHHRRGARGHGHRDENDDGIARDEEGAADDDQGAADDKDEAHNDEDGKDDNVAPANKDDASAAAMWGNAGEAPIVLPGAPSNDLLNSGMRVNPSGDQPTERAPVDAHEAEAEASEGSEKQVKATGRAAKIVTCPGCRLNSLPEVKRFVHELAKYFEPGLVIDFKIGEPPVLHLYDEGKKTESISLDKYTSDQIIQKLSKHGVAASTENDEVNRVIEAMDSDKTE